MSHKQILKAFETYVKNVLLLKNGIKPMMLVHNSYIIIEPYLTEDEIEEMRRAMFWLITKRKNLANFKRVMKGIKKNFVRRLKDSE